MMKINLTKQFSVILSIITIFLLSLEIASATPVKLYTNYPVPVRIISYSPAPSEINLTPQHRQQRQAIRQRRNQEIEAVLNSSQRMQFAHYLSMGNNISQALEKIHLQPEQKELIKAIMELTNLKLKAISISFD